MSIRALVRVACAAGLLAVFAVATASAEPLDRRTNFTFRNPTSVPGVTLAPGEYQFHVVDSSNRDVVQVLNADGTTPYAMFFAIPTWRPDPPKDSELRFMETAVGMPQAVKTWYYAGESIGREFLYPRAQARLLARGTGDVIATTESVPEEEAGLPDVSWTTPLGEETHEAPAAEPPALPYDEPVLEAQPASGGDVPEALPKTDSATTMRVLAGGVLLMAALGLRRTRAFFR
jgi:hypothetical protein